ncbi:MAG: methyl-accepting chemotaxis protein [Planctomycetes bacterium]|nr:methyl-accepting chemotaxis protein [Planctomycetota bacterium]
MEDPKEGLPVEFRRNQLSLTWKFMLLVVFSVGSVDFMWWHWSLGKMDQLQREQQSTFGTILDAALNRQADSERMATRGDAALNLAGGLPRPMMDGLFDPKEPDTAADKALAHLHSIDRSFVFVLALDDKERPLGPKAQTLWSSLDPQLKTRVAAVSEASVMKLSNQLWVMYIAAYRVDCLIVVIPYGNTPGKRDGLLIAGYEGRGTVGSGGFARDQATQIDWDNLVTRSDAERGEVKTNSAAMAVALLVAALLLTFGITQWFSSPLRELERTVKEVDREWDLTRRARVVTRDEIGGLGMVFNHMITRISDLVQKLQEASLQVGSSSSELLAASEEISQGARNQAKHIEDTSAAVTELSTSIQQVAGNARKAADTARKGGESVNKVVDHMSRIRRTVEETSEKIKELGRSSKEIGKIVGVITQISDQTSLLALNAAIEAARAGEHGKGFAVVADEVAKLADRVSRSAKEIEDLITAIREKTEQSVHSMDVGTAEVETGTGLVNDAGRNFLEIVDVVQETAASVQEQAKASDEISRIIAEILGIAKDTVSATEEAVAQGNELRDLALKLEELAKRFKVERRDS